MPRFDGTGPLGQGSLTGWGRGYCSSYSVPRYVVRRGLGYRWFGRGGRGFRNRYCTTGIPTGVNLNSSRVTEKEEIDILREEAELLKRDLENIQNRLDELNALNNQEDE